jgi:hypothetical protein
VTCVGSGSALGDTFETEVVGVEVAALVEGWKEGIEGRVRTRALVVRRETVSVDAGWVMVVGKKLRETVENQDCLTAWVDPAGRAGKGGAAEVERDADEKKGVDAAWRRVRRGAVCVFALAESNVGDALGLILPPDEAASRSAAWEEMCRSERAAIELASESSSSVMATFLPFSVGGFE